MATVYDKHVFRQLEEVMKKCDNLSQEIRVERKEHKKEIKLLNEKIDCLEKENKELKHENQKLRDDNDRLKKQLNNNSNNSSKPPSSDIKKNIPNNKEKTDKKSGGQKGHSAHFLNKKDVEAKIAKGEFKHEVINKGNAQGKYISKYVLDLKVDIIAKEYRFFKDENGKYNIPKAFYANVQYGNELKTMCAVLNTEEIVALDRLTNFVNCISHGTLNISKGSIVNFLEELDSKSEYLIKNIEEKVLNSELMYTDATTARCNNKNICVRNYSTPKYTLLIPTLGKSKKYIEETNILNRYTGDIVHDHETVIYNYGNRHIECNVHISRYLKGCHDNTEHQWALKMRALLCCLNEYRKKLKENDVQFLQEEQLQRYFKRYDEILDEGYKENKTLKSKFLKQEELNLLNRLKKYKENHIMFLYDFSVPFDNNLSERDLRHVKVKQKVSGHFNVIEGIKKYLDIKSIIGTFKKQGKNFYEAIFNIYENIPVVI